MFGFNSRRRKRLYKKSLPPKWHDALIDQTPYFQILPEDEQRQLLGHTNVLLHEKHFEGCGGLRLTERMKIAIAAHASILLINRQSRDYFPKLDTILVYPDTFVAKADEMGPDGVITEDEGERAGEAWDRGIIILAWEEVDYSCHVLGDGYNVVLHEFAHQLDFEDGIADGSPFLGDGKFSEAWDRVLLKNYEELIQDVRRRRPTLLDDYGATDPAEFFAVATETFFELPRELKQHHRDLYEVLRDYFRQDPAHWQELASRR